MREPGKLETEAEADDPALAQGTHPLEPFPRFWPHGGPDAVRLGAVPYPAFAIDRDGVIEDVNDHAAELVGYSRAELVGRPLEACGLRVPPPADPERAQFSSGGRATCVGRDRSTPVEMLAFGSDRGVVVFAIPREHGGLLPAEVAQIAHDFKNPIGAITLETCLLDAALSSELVADLARGAGTTGEPPRSATELLRSIARITRNAEFLDRMVHDLLDACALDAGVLRLRRVPTELRTLLEQTLARVVPQRDRGRVFLEAAAPITLEIDDLRIERVVANLLGNALKYSPASTGITVRLERLDPAWCRVSIQDGGPGLSPAEASRVFAKYRRGELATRDSSGLGLYISKHIIELHDGRIGVDSVHGFGSRFFFELPM